MSDVYPMISKANEINLKPSLALGNRFSLSPLIIAGVGLSDQHSGLWWLLAQRARNMSRSDVPANVYILVGEKDRSDFWRSRPFGIDPIVCPNWDEGWNQMLLKARNF